MSAFNVFGFEFFKNRHIVLPMRVLFQIFYDGSIIVSEEQDKFKDCRVKLFYSKIVNAPVYY